MASSMGWPKKGSNFRLPREHADLFRDIDRFVLMTDEINEKQETLSREGKVRTIITRKHRVGLADS